MFSCKGWTLEYLESYSNNFKVIPRVSVNVLSEQELLNAIDEHEEKGLPLIIEGYHTSSQWPSEIFNIDWLCDHWNDQEGHRLEDISVRNMKGGTGCDKVIPLSEFVQKSREMPVFTEDRETERLYGKDAPCPKDYDSWLHTSNTLPSRLLPRHPGNLLRNLPKAKQVETLMCYLGIGDTYTPCHKDLCGSSGTNLMCYTENGGSSFWLMTESSVAREVSDYFHTLQEELDHETHAITLVQLAQAPFNVYVGEQKLGDLVLVPPRSCHQVVNYGGITLKTAWSRMTLRGLAAALYYELPIYRRVCRPETYRVKSIIHHTLCRYTVDLQKMLQMSTDGLSQPLSSTHTNMLSRLTLDLQAILTLYDRILAEERPPAGQYAMTKDSITLTCDFCGADVFQSFLECTRCTGSYQRGDQVAVGDGYIICGGCYTEGRSCTCKIMTPRQSRAFEELEVDRRAAVDVLRLAQQSTDVLGWKPTNWDAHPTKPSQVFKAACILADMRGTLGKEKRGERTCSQQYSAEYLSHVVSFDLGATCRKCHRFKCYQHSLLQWHMHSVEVLVYLDEDPKNNLIYHHRHQELAASDGEARLLQLPVAEKTLSSPDVGAQLADHAKRFVCCMPQKPGVSLSGWYDRSCISLKSGVEHENPVAVMVAIPEVIYNRSRLTKKDVKHNSQVITTLPHSSQFENVSLLPKASQSTPAARQRPPHQKPRSSRDHARPFRSATEDSHSSSDSEFDDDVDEYRPVKKTQRVPTKVAPKTPGTTASGSVAMAPAYCSVSLKRPREDADIAAMSSESEGEERIKQKGKKPRTDRDSPKFTLGRTTGVTQSGGLAEDIARAYNAAADNSSSPTRREKSKGHSSSSLVKKLQRRIQSLQDWKEAAIIQCPALKDLSSRQLPNEVYRSAPHSRLDPEQSDVESSTASPMRGYMSAKGGIYHGTALGDPMQSTSYDNKFSSNSNHGETLQVPPPTRLPRRSLPARKDTSSSSSRPTG